jgi:mono/diheme cytochrome c family protein
MRKLILLSAISLVFSSCGYRGTDEAGLYGNDALLAAAPSTFQSLKDNVLTPNCISCHSAFATEAGLAFYLTPGNPDASSLYTRTASGSMPPSGKISNAKIDLIRRYIVTASGQGSGTQREEGPRPQPTSEPGQPPTFAQVRARIFEPMCLRCHGPNGFADPTFSDEASIRALSARILDSVESGRMPLGRVKPTADDKALLKAWVQSLQ